MINIEFRRTLRERIVFLVLAAAIVTSYVSLGAIGTEMVVRNAQAAVVVDAQV